MARDVAELRELRRIFAENALSIHFQPIVDLAERRIFGYEALMRGPAGGRLERPEALLKAAQRAGFGAEMEILAVRQAIERYSALQLPGRLCVNFSASVLARVAESGGAELFSVASRCGLAMSRLVIELTENERVEDVARLGAQIKELRKLGPGFAIDDFGDGRSSLRLWAQLEPDLVKLDKYFVRGIHEDARKVEVLRAALRLSAVFGTLLVGEGVESAEELSVLQDLGARYMQGYLCARPSAEPRDRLDEAFRGLLAAGHVAVLPAAVPGGNIGLTIERLVREAPPIGLEISSESLVKIFLDLPDVHALAVVKDGVPLGLINRQRFLDHYARPYCRELFGRRSCSQFMDAAPLVIDCDTPIDSLAEIMTGANQVYLRDGLIVTRGGLYLGLVTGEDLVRSVTERRIEAARHANPLTCLPGNIPITEHLRRLIRRELHFVVAYCDLNHFKPFNDLYGYWRGDEMIKMAANAITEAAEPVLDFVGHVGGDDFVVVFQSEDWLERCGRIRDDFNRRALELFDPRERASGLMLGEDRNGLPASFPLSTMAVGVVRVAPGQFRAPEAVASAAAAAKHIAKRCSDGIHIEDMAHKPHRSADALAC